MDKKDKNNKIQKPKSQVGEPKSQVGDLKQNEVLKISDEVNGAKDSKQVVPKSEENDKKKMPLKKKIIRTTIVILIIAAICVLGYYILVWTGAWEYMNSQEKVQNLIGSLGFWGYLLFVALQFLQVTFLPLPSIITTLAGVYVFGPLKASLLSLAGILLGSVFAFFLGRVFGRKLVVFMVGEETCEKWVQFLTDAKYSFFIMMVLPIFPDDVLCLVAGLTNMSWTFFVITNLISRPLAVFTTCYLGSGELIPYHGWGLAVWGVLLVVVIVVIILSYKYRVQIENGIRKIFRTKSKSTDSGSAQSVTSSGNGTNQSNGGFQQEKNNGYKIDKKNKANKKMKKSKKNKKNKEKEKNDEEYDKNQKRMNLQKVQEKSKKTKTQENEKIK